MKWHWYVAGLLTVLIAVAYGCADRSSPVDPLRAPGVRVGGPYLSLSTATGVVPVLKRTTPLARDLVASAEIGPGGGTLEIPAAGVRVVVPAGALNAAVPVSVRALAGDLVAYTFEPRGTPLAKVVTVEQSLAWTRAAGVGDLSGHRRGSFSSVDAIDRTTDRATVSGVSLVQYDVFEGSLRFFLNHFSGYLVSIP